MDEQAKASVILRDFLRKNPLQDESGRVYNPKTNKWEESANGGPTTMPQHQPMPMNSAWYQLPDFLDDLLLKYSKYKAMMNGQIPS